MKSVWFNCGAGVAGDMVLGALVDAGADPMYVGEVLGGVEVDDYALTFERTQRCGIAATRAIVAVDDHDHGGSHSHRALREIRQLIDSSHLPERVASRARAVFECLATVEAHIHGVEIDDVEFHEVGSTDAIVDIIGVCAALESLDVDSISCSPIAVGHGLVSSAHGDIPNPAPAVAHLLRSHGIPAVGLDDDRELSTPTGVALMAALSSTFGAMPAMTPSAVGHGAGSRDRPGRANIVSVVIGPLAHDSIVPDEGQTIRSFETNVDDVSGEIVGHTIAQLLSAGAHDAWASPIIMKKGRPAFTIHVLCEPARADDIARILIRETGSLGLRGSLVSRWPQHRSESIVVLEGHEIRVKISSERVKVEFDDAVRVARALSVPVRDIMVRAADLAR